MHDDSIIDVDEERHTLLPAEGRQLNLLQLCCGIDKCLEVRVPFKRMVIESLAMWCQVLVIELQNELAQTFGHF